MYFIIFYRFANDITKDLQAGVESASPHIAGFLW